VFLDGLRFVALGEADGGGARLDISGITPTPAGSTPPLPLLITITQHYLRLILPRHGVINSIRRRGRP
jgi:hypothetical protein